MWLSLPSVEWMTWRTNCFPSDPIQFQSQGGRDKRKRNLGSSVVRQITGPSALSRCCLKMGKRLPIGPRYQGRAELVTSAKQRSLERMRNFDMYHYAWWDSIEQILVHTFCEKHTRDFIRSVYREFLIIVIIHHHHHQFNNHFLPR